MRHNVRPSDNEKLRPFFYGGKLEGIAFQIGLSLILGDGEGTNLFKNYIINGKIHQTV